MERNIWARVLMAVVAAMALAAPAHAQATCHVNAESPGGNWDRHGGDLRSTRHQTAEETIGVGNVADLEVAWTWSTGEDGGFLTNSTIVGTCVFVTNEPQFNPGRVYAINVDTGELVWSQDGLPGNDPVTSGPWGAPSGAPVVVDGRVHVNMTGAGPDGQAAYATAFDAATGERLWVSEPISFGYTARSQSSPGVWDGVHFIATVGPDNDFNSKEGYAFLDAATGETLLKRTTLTPEQIAAGYTGGRHLDPAGDRPGDRDALRRHREPQLRAADRVRQLDPQDRHEPRDARGPQPRLRRDPRHLPRRPRQLAGRALRRLQHCQSPANPQGNSGFNFMCGQLDVDFGAGPIIIETPDGRTLLAEPQKSGSIHVVDTATMTRVWAQYMTYPWG